MNDELEKLSKWECKKCDRTDSHLHCEQCGETWIGSHGWQDCERADLKKQLAALQKENEDLRKQIKVHATLNVGTVACIGDNVKVIERLESDNARLREALQNVEDNFSIYVKIVKDGVDRPDLELPPCLRQARESAQSALRPKEGE